MDTHSGLAMTGFQLKEKMQAAIDRIAAMEGK